MDTTNKDNNGNDSNNVGMESSSVVDSNKSEIIPIKRNEKGQFLPGNPPGPGRTAGQTLKEFQAQMFRSMSDEDKLEWLKDINKDTRWKMGEGNPKQDVEANIKGELKIEISEDIAKKYSDTTRNTEEDSTE